MEFMFPRKSRLRTAQFHIRGTKNSGEGFGAATISHCGEAGQRGFLVVEKLQDGGRRIICGTRSRWSPAGYRHLMKWIDPQVFQRKLPTSRIVDGEEEAEKELRKVLEEAALDKIANENRPGPKLPKFRYTRGLEVDEESSLGPGD